jgi:solute carrier family 25 protein 46
MIGQHLLLKAVSLAVVTPFFSVSLIESVQSDIASESPVQNELNILVLPFLS